MLALSVLQARSVSVECVFQVLPEQVQDKMHFVLKKVNLATINRWHLTALSATAPLYTRSMFQSLKVALSLSVPSHIHFIVRHLLCLSLIVTHCHILSFAVTHCYATLTATGLVDKGEQNANSLSAKCNPLREAIH